MAPRQWHDRFAAALQRQGLPSAYAQRLLDELADHAADILMENDRMDAQCLLEERLGAPETLAVAANQELRRTTFAGRHPILTFVLGPLTTTVGVIAATVLAVVAIDSLVDLVAGGGSDSSDFASPWKFAAMYGLNLFVCVAPFAFSAWLFSRLGRRCEIPGWGIAACLLLACLALLFHGSVTGPDDGHKGTWSLGFGTNLGWQQACQALLPIALCCWTLLPTSSRRWQPAVS